MLLYNITIITEEDIEIEFKEWAHRVFLPLLAESQLFKSHSLLKLTNSPNEGKTFCIQLIADSAKEIAAFKSNQIHLLNNQINGVWLNKAFLFETQLEYITML